jgi:hypothetical protein
VRLLIGAAWVLFATLLALLSIADVVAISIERTTPLERNRGALIAIAAVAAAVCVLALVAAVQAARGRPGWIGPRGAGMLTSAALLVTLFFELAVYASGPL